MRVLVVDVGGGTVLDVEGSDDAGEAYEVDVRMPDGTEVDVVLDKDLNVLGQEAEAAGDRALTDRLQGAHQERRQLT